MKSIIKILSVVVLLFLYFSCSKSDINDDIQKSMSLNSSTTPYTDILSKYIDFALQYEFAKDKITDNPSRMPLEVKIDKILEFDNMKNTTGITESISDFQFYTSLYEQLILEINQHSKVIEYMENASTYGEIDPLDMMIADEGGDFLISKMQILLNVEEEYYSSSNEGEIQKLARYTGYAKWPSTIKYRIGKKVNNTMKTKLVETMEEWRNATNNKITFTEIANSGWNQFTWGIATYWHLYVDKIHKDSLIDGRGTLGYVAWAALHLSEAPGYGTCRHELGHILGMIHEHQRKDRDDYIVVYMDSVKPGRKVNFNKVPAGLQQTYGTFDFNSIMIYGYKSFGKKIGDRTATTMTKTNGEPFYSKIELSPTDIAKIKEIYK